MSGQQIMLITTRIGVRDVPMPVYPSIPPPEGTVWAGGELTQPVDANYLDTHVQPPSLFKTVRDDISRFSRIPVTRVALTRADNAYMGVIDSDGDPWYFAINSAGMRVRKANDKDAAWVTFNTLMDSERSAGLSLRRENAAIENQNFYISLSKSHPYGHIGYMKHTPKGVVYVKPKGVKPTVVAAAAGKEDFTWSKFNPFDSKSDKDAYDIYEAVKKQKPATLSEFKKHVIALLKKAGSGNVKGDADFYMTYVENHGGITPKSSGSSSGVSSYNTTVKKMMTKCKMNKDEAAYAAQVIDDWADSSTAEHACHLRGVVARAAGLDSSNELKAINTASGYPEPARKTNFLRGYNGDNPPPPEVVSNAIAKMVKSSQAIHKKYTGKTITLFRGVSAKQHNELKANNNRLTCGVLSSWSEQQSKAAQFAESGGVVVQITVPVEAVMISHRAVPGLLKSEHEVIIAIDGSIVADKLHSPNAFVP